MTRDPSCSRWDIGPTLVGPCELFRACPLFYRGGRSQEFSTGIDDLTSSPRPIFSTSGEHRTEPYSAERKQCWTYTLDEFNECRAGVPLRRSEDHTPSMSRSDMPAVFRSWIAAFSFSTSARYSSRNPSCSRCAAHSPVIRCVTDLLDDCQALLHERLNLVSELGVSISETFEFLRQLVDAILVVYPRSRSSICPR